MRSSSSALATVTHNHEPFDPYKGRVIVGRYRLITRVAEGGAGYVYMAEHLELRNRVAIKLLPSTGVPQSAIERFRREATASAKLRSPHVMKVFDFGTLDDGTLFLAMEMLVGEDLGRILRREGTLSQLRTRRFMRQLANALDSAHAQGVVHRDLKPENVYVVTDVVYDEFLKVIDFGIARQMFDESVLTEAGATLGTPGFLPPEQALAGPGAEVTPASDVYSLAAMALEMLTGHLPYAAKNPVELLQEMNRKEPRVPSDLGLEVEGLDDVFRKALSRDPRGRYATAGQFVDSLDAALKTDEDRTVSSPLAEARRAQSRPAPPPWSDVAAVSRTLPRPPKVPASVAPKSAEARPFVWPWIAGGLAILLVGIWIGLAVARL